MNRVRPLYAAAMLAAVFALAAFACAPPAEEPIEEEPAIEEEAFVEPEPSTATATLLSADGIEVGTATFTQEGAQTTASFHLTGAPAGTHAIHVHETGECTPPDFTSAGGHFNPAAVDHACPPTTPRHAGDFGNVEIAEDGTGHLEIATDLATVAAGPDSVVGKAVVLHEHQDDCSTQPTGDAGGRLACGVIEQDGGEMMMDDGMDDAEGEDPGVDL